MLRWSGAARCESDSHDSSPQTDVSVVTLFCTQEHGLLLQDCLPKPPGLQALLAVDVPHYYFSCKVRREHSALLVHWVYSTLYTDVGGAVSDCRSLIMFIFKYITLLIHNSVWSYVCMPAVILEGGVLSTTSKCQLQYLKQAWVFLIPVYYYCALRKCVSSDIPEIRLCRLPSQFLIVVTWSFDISYPFSKCSPTTYPFALFCCHLSLSSLHRVTLDQKPPVLTDLPTLSLVNEIRVYPTKRHQQLRRSPRCWRAHLPSSRTWCPGDPSEISWAWRTVRRPPVTLCSTSAFTSPLEIWMKLLSPSSSSRGKTSQSSH